MSLLGGSENIAGVVEKVEENGGGDGGEKHYLVCVEKFENVYGGNWNDRWALWRETWWGWLVLVVALYMFFNFIKKFVNFLGGD
jgi:hypothetical protein